MLCWNWLNSKIIFFIIIIIIILIYLKQKI